jgi:hypothetical protein
MREVNDAADVTIGDEEMEFYARQEDAIMQHQMMLMDINRQNPIHNLMPSLSFPQRAQLVLNDLNRQLDVLLDRRRTSPSSDSSSSFQRDLYAALQSPQRGDELAITYTQPRRQQQQSQQQLVMRNMFGPPPPLPVSNPGVGRPPGSSTDFVHVPVSVSPVRAPSPGASPSSMQSSSVRGSPISISSGQGGPISVSSGTGSPKAWPPPPQQTGSRVRSKSRPGTRAETNDPETGRPRGKAVEAKPKGRPLGSKNKFK